MITAEQLRGARAMLRWDQKELAESSGVSLASVKRFEAMSGAVSANAPTIAALQAALEAAGVLFVEENGEGPGVRLRKDQGEAGRLADYIAELVKTNQFEDAPAKAALETYAYLASLKPKPKDFRGVRERLIQLLFERVHPGDLADQVAAAIRDLH